MKQNFQARSRLQRTVLEARRTRAGLPPSRLRGVSFGGFGATSAVQPAPWQVDPTALRALVKAVSSPTSTVATQAASLPAAASSASWTPPSGGLPSAINFSGLRGLGRLGRFGFSPTADQAVSTVGSKVGAGAATSVAAAAGVPLAVAGPIGIAAGVVIALGIALFGKNYFNVGASNQACAQLEALWQKYTQIQGHVAGRALGFQTMNQLMHAAAGAGLFPGNDMHLSFHEGTLQCAGHGDWSDAFTGMTIQGNPGAACGAHNCLPDAFTQYQSQRGQIPAGTPDAIYLVDNILLPMNQSAAIPWIYQGAQNAQVHQMLYDLADAYIAQHGSGSTPYVEYPAQQVAADAVAGAEGAPTAAAAPSTQPTTVTTPVTVPAVTGIPSGWTQVGVNPLNGAPLIAQPGNSQVYQWANGQAIPYTGATTAVPPVSSTPAPAGATTPVQVATDPTTGLPIYQVPGSSQLYEMVNGQLTPYTPQPLANTSYSAPAPQTYYEPAPTTSAPTTAAPAGTTAAISTGSPLGAMSTGTLVTIGGAILGIYLITEMLEKRKKYKAKS